MKSNLIYILVLVLLAVNISLNAEELRALWIPSWDMTTRSDIEGNIKKAKDYDFNTLIVEVRFRSDTFYIPNRQNTQFPNPDSASRLLQEDFDALQHIIDLAYYSDLKVYAWFTMYVATGNNLEKCNFDNPWFRASHWITTDVNWQKMDFSEAEGAFLDPGLPEVQNYLYNVVMDVAVNYDIDGIQLDYIRYPGVLWGYHPESFARYQNESKKINPVNWHKWRCQQVTDLVIRIKKGLIDYAPSLELTAAVIADPDRAIHEYNQDWLLWLRNGYVNRVFPMNYHDDHNLFSDVVNKIARYGYENETVMGIRAWTKSNDYTADDINQKINYSWKKGIYSYALFSSTGINQRNYWKDLIIRKSR